MVSQLKRHSWIALLVAFLFGILASCSEDPAEPANKAPYPPSDPSPADSGSADIDTDLSWSGSDPDGDPVTFSVYFGTDVDPPRVVTDQSAKTHDPGTLEYNETYYWKVSCKDDHGAVTHGKLWMFSTVPNEGPSAPSNPSPANASDDQPLSPQMTWQVSVDPEGDDVTYDIYLDTADPPVSKVDSNLTSASYNSSPLGYGTRYYWQVVAKDDHGNATSGPVWNFTTGDNGPPTQPSGPSPGSGVPDQPITVELSWSPSTDPEQDAIVYDIYLGTSSPPPLFASGLTQTTYDPGDLLYGTTYYWQIIARDSYGNATPSAIWNFSTVANQAPSAPANPTPADAAVDRSITPQLSWLPSTDPEGGTVRYDVYFGMTLPPPRVVSNTTQTTYTPPELELLTTYYWQVIARDDHNNTTPSDEWSFTTVDGEWTVIFGPVYHRFQDIWGSSNTDIFVASDYNAIYHFDGSSWTTMTHANGAFTGVHGTSGSSVFVCGLDVQVQEYDGISWAEVHVGGDTTLYDIWCAPGGDVFAVGNDGMVLHYDGSGWERQNIGATPYNLSGVWGTAWNDVYAVGYYGSNTAVLHYNGSNWGLMHTIAGRYVEIWGASSSDIYVVESNGEVHHYDGSTWDVVFDAPAAIANIWGASSSNVYIVGSSGSYDTRIFHFNGFSWNEMPCPGEVQLRGIWGTSHKDIFAVGAINQDSAIVLRYGPKPEGP